jgi:arylsulfatase A-like enzyme
VVDLLDQEEPLRTSAGPAYWTTFGAARSDLPEAWHSTTWIGERALAEIDGWTDAGGQLLHVSFVKPHHPFDPPAPWDERYAPDALSLVPGWTEAIPGPDRPHADEYFGYDGLTEAALRTVMAHYYATITQLDHWVGLLLDRLRRRGMYDDTLVVFTSDHGEYLGFHHLLLKNGPMYDPLVKVPLVMKPAGGTRRAVQDSSLVSLVDVAPTVLAAAGVEPADPLPGLNLADPSARRSCVFAENRHGRPAAMARTATHKLLRYGDDGGDAFFDLVADPNELDNRIDDPAGAPVVRELRDALARWALFDAPPPVYLDEHAPRVDAPNVPPPDRARHTEHRDWFAARATEAAARPDFEPWRSSPLVVRGRSRGGP